MKTRKLILKIGVVLSLLFLFAVSASAANHVSKIDIDVTLNKDGSADIEQSWTGTFNEGTECYYEFRAGDRLSIEDFAVYFDGIPFKTLDRWNVNASFSEKRYKCGLNDIGRNAYEVCWGISDYGTNTYKIKYTVKNTVVSYEESDGFNLRFINPEMNTGPTDARIEFRLADGTPITDEICNIWGFGYDGSIDFYGETVVGSTLSPIGYNNHMTIMMEFEKGVFAPLYAVDGTFEREVKEPAFEDSDYSDEMSDGEFIAVLCIFLGVPLLVAVGLGIWNLMKKMRKRKIKKESPYYRDVPKEDINVSYALLNALKECDESSIIAARILRLILAGCIEPIDVENKGVSVSKNKVGFRIVKNHGSGLEAWDLNLMEILKASAGADDILEPGEMKRYCRKHPTALRKILRRCKISGEERLKAMKCSKNGNYSNIFKLTDNGTQLLSQLYGLEKYLLDFSLIAEKEIKETLIWQDYMVYATLLGIADKVADQLKKVYPEQIPEIERYERDIIFANVCRTHMYSNMIRSERAAEQARRSSGSGGRVSFGGGGGFSGGGFGGGTR